MTIQQLDSDLKQAMKDKNEIALSSLRNLKSEIKNVEIAKQKTLTEEEITEVVAKKVKQHKDSIEGFQAGGRNDLVEHEQQQMQILQKFLPEQMSEDQVAEVVRAVIAETKATASDFGKVMKEVMVRLKGKTDGSVVSKLVKQELK